MRFGNLVFTLCVCSLTTCFASASGQILSVYGMVGGTHSSGVQVSSAGATAGGWGGSYGGGATFNFLNLHVVKLGLDARGAVGGGSTKSDTAELSLRAGFQLPVIRLKPFVQVGVGYAGATVPVTSGVATSYTAKYVTVGGHAGLDRPLLPGLDWRVVDVGLAHGHDVTAGFSSGSGNKAANFFSLHTGLVVHF